MSDDGLFPALEAAERAQVAAAFARKDAIVARLREREADFTPRLVARAVVEAVTSTKRFLVTDCDTIIGVYAAADPACALDRYADDIGYADHAERVREAKFVGMLDMLDVVAIELVDDQVHVVFLEPTVTQVVHGDTRITCEHATQRTAEVYAVVEMLRSSGWSVRGPGSGDGFRRPLLLPRGASPLVSGEGPGSSSIRCGPQRRRPS